MTGDQLLRLLRNSGITVRARGGKISLTPKRAVTDELAALVEANLDRLLEELERWGGEAKARNFAVERPTKDELGMSAPKFPAVHLSAWASRRRPRR